MNHTCHSRPFALVIACGIFSVSSLALADNSSAGSLASPTATSYEAVAPADRTFFKKAAIGGLTEVEAGKLAAEKGSTDEVKAFGQRMVDDHTKANEELQALAAKKGVTLPGAPDKKHEAMIKALKSKTGKSFDAAFIADMKKGHTDAIAAFTAGSKSKDPDVADFAKTTLPTLKDHKAHIPVESAQPNA